MKAEPNLQATKLKILITDLVSYLPPEKWREYGLVVADGIAEINKLEMIIKGLEAELGFWSEPFDEDEGFGL